jgi:hypothetical protein
MRCVFEQAAGMIAGSIETDDARAPQIIVDASACNR